jgi:hypothetical protein
MHLVALNFTKKTSVLSLLSQINTAYHSFGANLNGTSAMDQIKTKKTKAT